MGVNVGLNVGSGVDVAVAIGTSVTTGVGAGVCVGVAVGVTVGIASVSHPIALLMHTSINNGARNIMNLLIASQIIACKGR